MPRLMVPEKLLTDVEKPARYIGGEINTYNKDVLCRSEDVV